MRAIRILALMLALASQAAWSAYEPPAGGAPPGAAFTDRDILGGPGAPAKAPAPPRLSVPDAASADEPGGDPPIRIVTPSGFLDYDDEEEMIYGRERTTIEYGDMKLEADRVMVDVALQEAQAEGNVILTRGGQEMRCDAMRYNFKEGTGITKNAKGEFGALRLRQDESGESTFEQLSKTEMLFRQSEITTCDFPIPMYTLRAKEIVILDSNRALLRSVTLRVHDVPVLYLPFYSRALKGGTPWFTRIGISSNSGAYIRVGYSFRHRFEEPSWEDDSIPATRSRGHMDIYTDFMSKRGAGAGLDYTYEFDFERHQGRVQLYGIGDSGRDVRGNDADDGALDENKSDDSGGRWLAYARHSSRLTDEVYLQLKSDWISDPELFYDVLDSFQEAETGRVSERGAQAALVMNQGDYLGRIRLEIRDRIGRNRFSDRSDPTDDNLDFDVQPGLSEKEDEGIPSDRWGTVALKAPEINLTTNDIRLGRTNWYSRTQLNLFNSLDRGLNTVADGDFQALTYVKQGGKWVPTYVPAKDADAYVRGADLYQSLMNIYRFNERVTWLNRVGVGAGAASRGPADGDLVSGSVFTDGGFPSGEAGYYDGLYFADPNTFHIGESDQLRSYDDISAGFMYSDVESRLNARFTEALTGYARYTGRVTTTDYIGDWYASMGDPLIRQDLYNFPLRRQWLEGRLNYAFFQPNINLFTGAGLNMLPASSLYPNERLWYYTIGGDWHSYDEAWELASALTFSEVQYFHPDDPRSYQTGVTTWRNTAGYYDPSDQWWATVSSRWEQYQRELVADNTSLFEEGTSGVKLEPGLGVRIGPKWSMESFMAYDSRTAAFEDANFSLHRDMHDALLALRIRVDRDVFARENSDEGDDAGSTPLGNIDVSFTIQPKLPNAETPFRSRQRETVGERFRETALEVAG